MEKIRVEEILQEEFKCYATTSEDLEIIKELFEKEIEIKVIDGKVYDEAGTWVADVAYYD